MREFLNIGSVPANEECAQVGSPNYDEQGRRECNTLINQLRRIFGNEPNGAKLVVKGFSHEFGRYYEVICQYEDSIKEAVDYAFKLEANLPEQWDDIAKAELNASKPRRTAPPSQEQLEDWMMDGVAEATDGCQVEPDGTCPHGCKSWLLELGLM